MDLVVVGGHPGEQDEGAPVVAEVGDDEGPHRLLAQQQLPRDLLRRLLWVTKPTLRHSVHFIQLSFLLVRAGGIGRSLAVGANMERGSSGWRGGPRESRESAKSVLTLITSFMPLSAQLSSKLCKRSTGLGFRGWAHSNLKLCKRSMAGHGQIWGGVAKRQGTHCKHGGLLYVATLLLGDLGIRCRGAGGVLLPQEVPDHPHRSKDVEHAGPRQHLHGGGEPQLLLNIVPHLLLFNLPNFVEAKAIQGQTLLR